jgi:hypothetical protein
MCAGGNNKETVNTNLKSGHPASIIGHRTFPLRLFSKHDHAFKLAIFAILASSGSLR